MRIKLMTLCMALCCLCFNAFAQNVPDYVPTDGLVGWWPMNGNVDDAIGFLHGFNQGGIETEGPYGQIGQAIELPSGDDYIDLPTGGVNEEGGLTLAFWAWLELPTEGAAPLIDRVEVSNNLWSFSYEQSSETVHFITRNNDGSGYHNLSTWSPPAAEWVHVTSVYRAPSGLKELHVNGILVGEELAPLDGFTMPTMRLGEVAEGTWNSNCRFSKVGVWERALVEEEILALYNAQLPVLGCTDSIACNFNEEANEDDESCIYPLFGNDCEEGGAACGEGTIWDHSIQACVCFNDCPSDLNGNGLVEVSDLLMVLADFGTECAASDDPEPAEWTCSDPVNYHGYDYATVQIGEQCWFAENLRTAQYSNGDEVPHHQQGSSWLNAANAESGAWAHFSNNSASGVTYGKLYNWYVMVDERGICPTGWHAPENAEWSTLVDHYGGSASAAIELKGNHSEVWFGNGTDGFNALPGGFRDWGNATFFSQGTSGDWWTSSHQGSGFWRGMDADLDSVHNALYGRAMGNSIRCLKDTE